MGYGKKSTSRFFAVTFKQAGGEEDIYGFLFD